MRLISQDWDVDTPYEMSALSVGCFGEKTVIYVRSKLFDEKPCVFAKYISEEYAKKVLTMLRTNYLNGDKIFYFPKEDNTQSTDNFQNKDDDVAKILLGLSIYPHIKGYRFLKDAILMVAEKPYMLDSIMKTLYPAIAKENNTTPSSVERGIRTAIEIAWSKGNPDIINSLFMDVLSHEELRNKPSNGKFIAIVCEKIKSSQ